MRVSVCVFSSHGKDEPSAQLRPAEEVWFNAGNLLHMCSKLIYIYMSTDENSVGGSLISENQYKATGKNL